MSLKEEEQSKWKSYVGNVCVLGSFCYAPFAPSPGILRPHAAQDSPLQAGNFPREQRRESCLLISPDSVKIIKKTSLCTEISKMSTFCLSWIVSLTFHQKKAYKLNIFMWVSEQTLAPWSINQATFISVTASRLFIQFERGGSSFHASRENP